MGEGGDCLNVAHLELAAEGMCGKASSGHEAVGGNPDFAKVPLQGAVED